MSALLHAVSRWALPLIVIAVTCWGLFRRVRVYHAFVEGAKEGLATALRIAPYLLAMLVAIGVFRAAGGINLLVRVLAPLLGPCGIPPEVVPLGILRPLSGSGSLGYLANLLESHGPDSPVGLLASIVQGSTETTFYVLTVYLGAVGLHRPGRAVWAGIAADLAGFAAAVVVTRVFF
ncbi:MAG: spore maturation protein [Patescibacteria group bacterium]